LSLEGIEGGGLSEGHYEGRRAGLPLIAHEGQEVGPVSVSSSSVDETGIVLGTYQLRGDVTNAVAQMA
jgi:hypothetical protein